MGEIDVYVKIVIEKQINRKYGDQFLWYKSTSKNGLGMEFTARLGEMMPERKRWHYLSYITHIATSRVD